MIGIRGQALDRSNFTPLDGGQMSETGIGSGAVDMHGTSPALTDSTTEFGAREFKMFSDHP